MKEAENEFNINLVGKVSSKWEALIKILQSINKSAESKFDQFIKKNSSVSIDSQPPVLSKRKIMIIVRTDKCKRDLERYLSSYFLKEDNGRSLIELNLKNFLNSQSYAEMRTKVLQSKHDDKNYLIEQYLLEKLHITLTQKYNAYFQMIKEKFYRWKYKREKELKEDTLNMTKEESKAVWDEFNQICKEDKEGSIYSETTLREVDSQAFRYDRIFPKCHIEIALNNHIAEFS